MDNSEILKNILLKNFEDARSASNGREIALRCRFCGDSQKDINARHLYVYLGGNNKPPMYHCFKCNESGILTKDTLRKWMPTISELDLSSIDLASKNYKRIYKKESLTMYSIFVPMNKVPSNREQEGMLYLQKRLGLSMDYREAVFNKIILDPVFFFRCNANMITNKSIFSYIKNINEYIGFLSLDNSCVVLRNIRNREPRYMHVRLVDNRDTVMYYCLPAQINRMCSSDENRVHIHIAEGAFDILGVCYNLLNNNRNQSIFITSNGKDHTNTILFALNNFGLFEPVIHLYLDNDTNANQYYNISKKLNSLGISLIFHKNYYNGEKDYGVQRDRILDRKFKLRIK